MKTETWSWNVSPDPISIPRVEVFPNRLRILVRLGKDAPRSTTAPMIGKAVEAYPTLLAHSCINSQGPTFGDVAVGTSVPHLLEHLIIAAQVSLVNARLDAEAPAIAGEGSSALEAATFVGTTEWVASSDGDTAREAVVEVSFVDDLEAITALSHALAFLNACL